MLQALRPRKLHQHFLVRTEETHEEPRSLRAENLIREIQTTKQENVSN
jgi:hypothetical protein